MIHARKAVECLSAYRPPLEGRREAIRLDFNENTVGFPETWGLQLTHGNQAIIPAYPEYTTFIHQLATYLNVEPDWILLTNASDEALFVVSSTFIEPGKDTALVSQPTFALISHYLRLAEATVLEVPILDSLQFDVGTLEATLSSQNVKLAIFASPDNPSGAVFPLEVLERWCCQYPHTLFVLDEAYYEYIAAQGLASALPLVAQYENLMVTRTFSKAWGLAGIRLGYLVGHPRLIDLMKRVRSPYSVNALSVHVASQMLPHAEAVMGSAALTLERKKKLICALEDRGYEICDGAGNFFLIRVGRDAKRLAAFLHQRGVLIRDRSDMPKLGGMVRVSIGTDVENKALLEGFDAFRQTHALIFDLDDTLVDTSQSFNTVVKTLVEKYSGAPLTNEDLTTLRAEGGFNDDWDATVELLKRRGVIKNRESIAKEADPLYLTLAKTTETLMLSLGILKQLGKRYRLFIVTGRSQQEYDPLWKDTFELGTEPLFEAVLCSHQDPALRPKPFPDMILAILKTYRIDHAVYIGNNVDDMQAACAAGIEGIAVATTLPPEILLEAGAKLVVPSSTDLKEVFSQ